MTPFSHNDDPERAIKVHVTQGESHVTTDPQVVMTTVLGSCIAACIRDPQAGVGGMNHFLLPDAGDGRGGDAVRYGAYAMELLINDLLKKGARRERLEAKIFGGAKLFDGLSDVGASNSAFAERFLREKIYRLPGMRQSRTTFGLRTLKRAISVDPLQIAPV